MANEMSLKPRRMTRHDYLLGLLASDIRKHPGPVPKRDNSLAFSHAAERVIDCYRDPTPAD